MINLLPQEIRGVISQERFSRFLIFCSCTISFIFIVGILLLGVSWFALHLQERNVKDQLDTLFKAPVFARMKAIESELLDLNKEISVFEKNQKKALHISSVFEKSIAYNDGIRIESFSYDNIEGKQANPQFSMRGTARDRDTFLSFIGVLEKESMITNVRSPISNLLQEKNVDFLLTFEGVPSELQFKLSEK